MKKYFLSALALPLLFACSSEDYLDQKATDNDQFAGIEKVDATFTMDEGPKMRMDNGTGWELANGDLYGFAWLTDDHTETGYTAKLPITTGEAYQNHNLIQTNGIFKPQTSIYVGKYFIYRPYDETTVAPGPIKFNSLKDQTLAEGQASGFGTNVVTPWKKLAETAIIIGDKWTEILPAGHTYTDDDTVWDLPGIDKPYKIYAAFFSNQTGLDLTYEKNNPSFSTAKTITGATDINLTYKAGEPVGAADIYGATVQLQGATNSFTYAPTTEPSSTHSGTFWADKKNLGTAEGFNFATEAPITLTPADQKISTGAEGSKAWFWFNSLPVTAGDATSATKVTPVFKTSYGTVTINTANTLKDVAYEFVNFGTATAPDWQWVKLVDGTTDDESTTPKKWAIDAGAPAHNTFVNQYGNHRGKYTFTVDFSTAVMDKMHIIDDTHLQKLLRFYLASGKNDNATLLLDKDADGEFKISKISIALLQTINASSSKVLVKACDEIDGVASTLHKPGKIVVTQDGQEALGLADKKEVPALDKVFAIGSATDVYLSSACEWTWAGGEDGETALPVDADVKSLTNEGTLTVNATKFGLSIGGKEIKNAAGATMNITKVTTVRNPLTNLGKINVGSATNTSAELRAYGVEIKNDATALDKCGVINNYGVVGVTDGTPGKFNNYGLIDMKDKDAITLLSTNELTSDFDDAFDESTNKMGTVQLPENNPTAIVSVNNTAANGFIKYPWPATQTTYVTPAGNVKYNTIVVSGNIEFTEIENEIQYVVFDGTRTQVVNNGYLKNLKGVIVNAKKSIIIEKGNKLIPSDGTFLGTDATVYNGGTFTHNAKTVSGTTVSNYFGEWSTDQIVKY